MLRLWKLQRKIISLFIATNIPRRYASQVAKFGLESLDTLPANIKNGLRATPHRVRPRVTLL